MDNKRAKYTFRGINQDISKSKHMPEYYFEAENIRLLATDSQSSGGVSNEKGNELVFEIPDININQATNTISYGDKNLIYSSSSDLNDEINSGLLPTSSSNQNIIGSTPTRDSIIFFSTDSGMDCVWELQGVLTGNFELVLLYVRNLEFSKNNPIQAIFNFENENIQKVYWVDGKNQIRFINIKNDLVAENTLLIDLNKTNIDFVGVVDFSQPVITDVITGGSHTAGMIQYVYNLYRLNGAQTKISPASELIPLDKGEGQGGGEVNEVVSSTPIVKINDVDKSFTNIRVYAIKYTSINELPSVNLIEDREIGSSTSIEIRDDGTTISSLSLDELLFLGSNPIIPKHIESKDNILFPSSIKDKSFDVPDTLDTRAYSFEQNSTSTRVYNNIVQNSVGNVDPLIGVTTLSSIDTAISNAFNIPLKHDSINARYDLRKYKANSSELGGTGKYLEYTLNIVNENQLSKSVDNLRLFKSGQLYRIGIQFYNRLGQKSPVKWIADFLTPSILNINGEFLTLEVTLKPEFFTWLNTYNFESEDDKPVGFKIMRVERQQADKFTFGQGIVTTMMVNSRDTTIRNASEEDRQQDADENVKLSNFLVITFSDDNIPMRRIEHLKTMQFNDSFRTSNRNTEVAYDPNRRKSSTYQYSTMVQLLSPEAQFSTLPIIGGLQLRYLGLLENTKNEYWGKELRVSSQEPIQEGKVRNGLTPHLPNPIKESLIGNVDNLMDRGLISDTNGDNPNEAVEFNQWYREFSNFNNTRGAILTTNIYGVPQLTRRGQGLTIYNNDSKYQYANTLEGFLSDGEHQFDNQNDFERAIISLNSFHTNCITLVPDIEIDTIGGLFSATGTNTVLIAELSRPMTDLYFGNIYGGNSFEDRSRNIYIEIGDYKDLNPSDSSVLIENGGDIYLNKYRVLRIGRTDVEIFQIGINQLTEIVEFPVESEINLKNRHDISGSSWEAIFQPKDEDYHKYNRVYSQMPTLINSPSKPFNFRRINDFDARIQATKTKIPNEDIDSWTDILINEVMDLNGKYGPINNVISFQDNLFAFQDEAIAKILINPRVQVQGQDGISLELGTGGILYDFDYLTTKSGSINKWGILPTKKGIYYYDAFNKALGRVPDATKIFLSDIKGLHSYFNNNFDYNALSVDNPYLRQGALLGYDNYNNDVYISLLQGDKSFTRCFNESLDEFIDLKKYKPSMYIYKGERFFTLNPSNNKLYQQDSGLYNHFFDEYSPSTITLMLNPESDYDTVFNNIHFNSELYLNDIDQPDKTLTHIRAYNEYQDSGRIPLINRRGKNLNRLFREWRANIPRVSRNRVRNPWIFLKLELDNESNYKMILHDIILHYSV